MILSVSAAVAQTSPSPGAQPAPAPAAPKDPLGRETPQGLVTGLISAFAAGDYDRATRFFTTKKIAGTAGTAASRVALAKTFQQVLDRNGRLTTPAELSTDPTGRVDDGLGETLERIGTIQTEDGAVEILAERVDDDGVMVWVVSAKTLSAIPALARTNADSLSFASLTNYIPAGPVVGGAPVVHWGMLLVIAGLAYVAAWLVIVLVRLIVRLIKRAHGETPVARFMEAAAAPARLLLTAVLFVVALRWIEVTVVIRYYAEFGAQLVSWFGLAWLLWRLSGAAGEVALGRMSRRGQLSTYAIVSFLRRIFQGLVALALVAALLHVFGIDFTTALAALGIGGLAIALGAQKFFENLIGSLTLILDQPVRVGDFCRFGTALGTIEDIGMRSTRIRTLDRTVLTVPNGEFSALHIENFSRRDRFWFHPTLNLRYETDPDRMRFLLQELRAMLLAHPRVDPDPARVRFVRLGSFSLDVEIFAYVYAVNFDDYLEVQEDLLLRCMDIVAKAGTGFAFPSQTVYVARDCGSDDEKATAARETVKQWREAGELQIPRFHPDRIRELRNTLEYPPPGAAVR
ncbi:mechanosensitive ion channel family protein [Blastochloris sulfoviridis]|uniref:Mechanosensitive ion channel family protein n=1 Tax=Blastochloris sulfoviridis TaxID=50712 RepID=A0A5M6I688_9HYPH|nr:mechanosensitive ion channel family protein [Blastochloris sulfoviridis]KAA5603345.1 mechanosensitive ion channel family protein [Blastochloris sulfoviridis]